MKPIRFALAQINPTVGDFEQNTRKIIDSIYQAEKKHADLVVFPEIALSGYPVWDLANKESFVEEGLRRLAQVEKATAKLHVTAVLGYIEKGSLPKSRSRNAMAWISQGKTIAKYIKRLLPTYDVFLEDIFFEPGTQSAPVNWRGMKVGPTICEDIWDQSYREKPLGDLAKRGIDFAVNISASPYYQGVQKRREDLVRAHCKRYGFPLLYVNQVGTQDDLIFDGQSFFCGANGKILFRAPAFQEGLYIYDWNPVKNAPSAAASGLDTTAEVYNALVLGLSDYCRKNGFKKAVIGLSGGIDSALVAAIAVDALGPSSVLGVTMPSSFSSKGSWMDSQELAKRLGIVCLVHPIKDKYELFMKQFRRQKKKEEGVSINAKEITLPMENLQARLRGIELMFISNNEQRLLLSTGNKSEMAMGYCTLYGDMAGGLAVIGDVFKTGVYRLAEYRNRIKEVIPKSILKKSPSAELRPNQKDQDSLPPYDILDAVLGLYIEQNQSPKRIYASLRKKFGKKITAELILKIIRQVDHNEYKRRQTPPILRVTQKAWFGRRMPITNRFQH